MAQVIDMPKLGFDMAEGTLIRWVKSTGDPVAKGEVLAEIETDKATVEVESQASGVVRHHLVEEGTAVPVGQPIAVIGEADEEIDLESLTGEAEPAKTEEAEGEEPERGPTQIEAEAEEPAAALEPEESTAESQLPGGVRASPVARRMAEEHDLDLKRVDGSGPKGRVVKADVEAALEAEPSRVSAPRPMVGESRPTERLSLSKLRSRIGQRMQGSKQQVPHFYVTADLDAGPLMDMRKSINAQLPEEAALSVNDFIVKAAAVTLREFPALNASLEGDEIVRHGEINIGVAVAVEDGLLTVVGRNADVKPLRQLSAELSEAIGRAREGRVRPEDVEGSTFTVSNMGMFQVDHFIAIINPPEAGILAIGSVREEPVVVEGQINTGRRMKVTLSADHRVTDGAEAARWLQVFRTYIEHPATMLV